jgi:hypothetical protein
MAHEYSHFVNIRKSEMSFSVGETRTKTAKRFIVTAWKPRRKSVDDSHAGKAKGVSI